MQRKRVIHICKESIVALPAPKNRAREREREENGTNTFAAVRKCTNTSARSEPTLAQTLSTAHPYDGERNKRKKESECVLPMCPSRNKYFGNRNTRVCVELCRLQRQLTTTKTEKEVKKEENRADEDEQKKTSKSESSKLIVKESSKLIHVYRLAQQREEAPFGDQIK